MRGPVVYQALFLDESYFSASEWSNIVSGFGAMKDNPDDDFFKGFAATVRLFQMARKTLSQSPTSTEERGELVFRATLLYHNLVMQMAAKLELLEKTRKILITDPSDTDNRSTHFLRVREYGMLLPARLLVGNILGILCKDWYDLFKGENAMLCEEACDLVEETRCYRPIGSLWGSMMLSLAYTGSSSTVQKAKIAELVAEFSREYRGEEVQAPGAALSSGQRCS